MKKTNLIFIAFLFFASYINIILCSANEQIDVLNESLLSQTSFNTFTAVNVKGYQSWYFDANYGACMTGYQSGASYENEDWFISPAMYLSNIENPILSFEHTRGNAGVLNVGVAAGWYKVFATDYYTGNMETTVWTEITGVNHSVPRTWEFIS